MSVIKLWEGFAAPKKVQFEEGGEVFELPPDLPAELYFEIMALQERENVTEMESFRVLYDGLLDLCRYRRPDLEELPVGLSQLVTAVARIYGQDPEVAEPEQEAPPRKPSAGGTRSSSRPRRTSKPSR